MAMPRARPVTMRVAMRAAQLAALAATAGVFVSAGRAESGGRLALASASRRAAGDDNPLASGPSTTLGILATLHRSNRKSIVLGTFAQEHGKSLEIRNFGRMLVKDHTTDDKKVVALAEEEGVKLPALEGSEEGSLVDDIGHGPDFEPDFDAKFAEVMLEDHRNDLSEAIAARANTRDPKLKALLTAPIPVLEKQQNTARALKNELARAQKQSMSTSMSTSTSTSKESP